MKTVLVGCGILVLSLGVTRGAESALLFEDSFGEMRTGAIGNEVGDRGSVVHLVFFLRRAIATGLLAGAFGNWAAGALIDRIYRLGKWTASRRLPAMIGFSLAVAGLLASVHMDCAGRG